MEKNYTDKEFEFMFNKILKTYKSFCTPSSNPKTFLVLGQPGAGKSKLINSINKENNFITISGDDFREFHPKFNEFYLKYGKDDSKYTQEWASRMTEKLIDTLSKENYNLIIEGTLRTAELPLKEANRFKKLGYEIEANIIVVKPEKSRLGTLMRYEEMLKLGKIPRMTPKEHHDLVVNNITNNLETLYSSKAFDNIKLFDRDNNLLYNYKESSNINPKAILEKEFYREWKIDEIKEFKENWENLIKMIESRKAPLNEISDLKIEKEQTLNKIVIKTKELSENDNPWKKKIENSKSKGLGR